MTTPEYLDFTIRQCHFCGEAARAWRYDPDSEYGKPDLIPVCNDHREVES